MVGRACPPLTLQFLCIPHTHLPIFKLKLYPIDSVQMFSIVLKLRLLSPFIKDTILVLQHGEQSCGGADSVRITPANPARVTEVRSRSMLAMRAETRREGFNAPLCCRGRVKGHLEGRQMALWDFMYVLCPF